MEVQDYRQALLIYKAIEVERRECKEALRTAQSIMQQAAIKAQEAQDRLTEADFQYGRVRYLLRRGGFEEVFRQKTCPKGRRIVKFRRMFFFLQYFRTLLMIAGIREVYCYHSRRGQFFYSSRLSCTLVFEIQCTTLHVTFIYYLKYELTHCLPVTFILMPRRPREDQELARARKSAKLAHNSDALGSGGTFVLVEALLFPW